MDSSRYRGYLVALVVCVVIFTVGMYGRLCYTISSKAIFVPASEFTITRTIQGNLISSLTNHRTDLVEKYSVTEFQRGDVVELVLSPRIVEGAYIMLGDTLGYIASNEEMRNLLALEGQLAVLKAELEFFTTGQKPEDVLLAQNQIDMAEQELHTQQLLTQRAEKLLFDGAISQQEYDIALNSLKVRELGLKIAKANWLSITTGEKPEQEKLTLAQIDAVSLQIAQIRKRLQSLVLIAPVSGKVILHRNLQMDGQLLTLADTTAFVAYAPILLRDRHYLKIGVSIESPYGNGAITHLDNSLRIIGNQQAAYARAEFQHHPSLLPGLVAPVKIATDTISPFKYLGRLFGIDTAAQT
jgi:hypothetical protein